MRPNSNGASLPDEAAVNPKRKLGDLSNDAPNPKLQEYLKVMQPPFRSKVWANEDTNASGEGITADQGNLAVNIGDDESDDQYQPVAKKRRKSVKDAPDQGLQDSSGITELIAQESHQQTPTQVTEDEMVEEEVSDRPVVSEHTASDVDWLRSRTSRLLGLVDDEDDAKVANMPAPDGVKETKVAGQPQPDATKQISDAGSQTAEKLFESHEATVLPLEVSVEEPISTARLFVRNLSYITSQNDLRDYFSQHGDVSEVRRLADLVDLHPFDAFVMNTLIGTAYALHMMLFERVF